MRRNTSIHDLRPRIEQLENRINLTGNLSITNAFLVNSHENRLTSMTAGERVYVQVNYTARNLPTNASYDIAFTVNGLTRDSKPITYGAGISKRSHGYYYVGPFVATSGANQVSITLNPERSVSETSYADNLRNFKFSAKASGSSSAASLSYSIAQIRDVYGINSIPKFGHSKADGTGQTIAIVEIGNDPSIQTDLEGFDEVMHLSTNSSPTLAQGYGSSSSFLTIYNQDGVNITSDIEDTGKDGVPPESSSGIGEETLDVEWAHAIAPGAKIDVIEMDPDGSSEADILAGDSLAATLQDVSVVSNSYGYSESQAETSYDSKYFVTPSGHTGVTFLASTGDTGSPGSYPAFSPYVVAVGGTQLSVNSNNYGGETGWSYPTPRTLNSDSATYSPPYDWANRSGGLNGTYRTTAGGVNKTATWTTTISSSDQGHNDYTEVSATWVANAGNSPDAIYKIYDSTTGKLLFTKTVNQRTAPVGTSDGNSQFQKLGIFKVAAGVELTIVLSSDSANGTVDADAIGISRASASGGGQSRYEPEPSYQTKFQRTGSRTIPDVSFDGSNLSGVTDFQNGMLRFDNSGTSLSSPCWAGLIAIVNQGRVAKGRSTLNSTANPSQALQAIYSLPERDFHDITSGYNGTKANAGYDEVTGRGSPVANRLVPGLVSYGKS
jgi:subtilase family serine protease